MDNPGINSNEYWDNRFNNDWESCGGKEQTAFFGNLAINNSPGWFANDVRKHRLSICDWGCAEGTFTDILSELFVGSEIIGVDTSHVAIEMAKNNYPEKSFLCTDIDGMKNYDVIFSSNTLEHFEDPFKVIKDLSMHSKKYLVFLLPFQERDRIKEHFYTFEYKDIPLKIGDFSLRYFKVIDTISMQDTFWPGKQVLLIFEKLLTADRLSLSSIGVDELSRKIDAINSSRFWKVVRLYCWIRDNYAYKSLKVLKNEGLGVFIKKSMRKVKEGALKLWGDLEDRFPLDKAVPPTAANANKYDIIFFSIINWGFRFQRPQHIATRFTEAGHRVFYLSVDLKSKKSYAIRQILENLYEVSLPFVRNAAIYNLDIKEGMGLLSAAMEDLFRDYKIKESVAIVEFPLWYPLVMRLKQEYDTKIIFDCFDEFSEFDNISADIGRVEDLLASSADYCITTAMKLHSKLKGKCKNVDIIKNATEFKHFHKLPVNDVLSKIKKPIVGYYGAIAEWFDTDIIEHMAVHRPEWSIVLIGHTFGSDIKRLGKYSNIHVLGEIPYAELPKYLYGFDVCMIPFRLTDLTLSINPVKFYEYISSGKPVVSTMLPELHHYSDLLYLSQNKEEFLENVEEALNEKGSDLADRRIALAKENDWDVRVARISRHIRSVYPLVSVIIVTFNNLEYTKECIESIYSKTAYPDFELIVVDNASSDGTQEYLSDLKEQKDNIKVILNEENLGFAKANNIGINKSAGEYIIFLNNDTLVTRGWISGLLKHLKDTGIGMAGPVTNSIGNEARIAVRYTDLSGMERFAEEYTAKNRGAYFEIPVLALYCAAIRREVVNRVGLLDEQFKVGMFEDDDYAMRLRRAGYKSVCSEDVFVHHHGGASFGKLQPAEYQKVFEENRTKFENKWDIRWQPHKLRNM